MIFFKINVVVDSHPAGIYVYVQAFIVNHVHGQFRVIDEWFVRAVWPRRIEDLRFHESRKSPEGYSSLNGNQETRAPDGDDVDRPNYEESENSETHDDPGSFAGSIHMKIRQ